MADHSKPTVTSTYANYTSELDGRLDDLALGLDPATTSPTNVPTNAIRWASASNKWQKWNGSSWNDLSANYNFTAVVVDSLGVGTDSPNAILDVQGEGTLDTEIEYAILRGGGSSQPCLRIGGNNTTNSSIRHAFINSENINGGAQALAFQTGGSEAMRITSDGEVGIGTDSPDARLNVVADTSSDAVRITQTGAGNALVVEDASSPDSTPFVIDSLGRVINGATQSYETVVSTSTATPSFQHHSLSSTNNSFGLYAWNAANNWMSFSKAGVGGVGNYASVSSGNALGLIQFNGADGSNFVGAAQISAYVDGTPSANDMPGRLVFSTTADGENNPTERMRITSDGSVGIGTSSPNATLEVSVGGANRAVRLYNSDTALSDNELGHAIEFTQNDAASPNGTNAWIKTFGNGSTGNLDLAFATGGSNSPAERMRITSTGSVGIGTDSPTEKLDVNGTIQGTFITSTGSIYATNGVFRSSDGSAAIPSIQPGVDADTGFFRPATNTIGFSTAGSERVRIDAAGNVMFSTTNATPATNNVEGHTIGPTAEFSRAGSNPVDINRVNDGSLIIFRGQGTAEGNISVSGTTVSYNGGHLARWAQTLTPKDESLVKGTVLSNLDEMNVYVAPTTYWTEDDELPEGVNIGDVKVETHVIDNEQLNKVKVSDVEGDANVAGVFVNWDYDEQHNVDEINMAMTGDMIIRIAAGTTVARGDLLMSAGDGTAKPQGDDIVRSKTIAKVTSTHVTCTYEDGSFCVPCVLMAC